MTTISERRGGVLGRELRGAYAFIERNANLIKRYWAWELVWLAYSIVNALSITFIGRASGEITGVAIAPEQINTFILFLLVGTLVWHYLSVVFDLISESIQWERWEGTIEYTFMAPISRLTHLFGQAAFAVLFAVVHTAIILAVVSAFFRIDLSRADFGAMLVVLIAGSTSFIGLGMFAAILPLLSPEKGLQMTNIIKAMVLLVSGVYYPVSVLPEWLQPLAYISPATYMLDGIRAALLEGASVGTLWSGRVLPLLLTGLLTIPTGLLAFMRAERYAKATGRLKRNG
ncbi:MULTISPECIES: ABC transporter permease [unclassified Roseiflexus]|jgi:ABC-type multidrug transport system, permease component|uniref:ABC transporter permease n=1 Tax=unclassified Roseiflexus TaxID=2609473 RepID=UPI0000D7F8F4|nr:MULTISPECIES: ABC transporter permease [unclassified Roseiflexus]ABQ90854.1 ABC-2 type transporter [Roseiflexus sp. RS-1]MBO9341520.1 ABC transporter permease [Roseiflexus sp.]MCL6539457.1 ABC transporter permease [Roseiflexus sp.]